MKIAIGIFAGALLSAGPAAAQKPQTFRGAIIDSTCAPAHGHEAMLTKGQTMAECTRLCVKKGATYELINADTKTIYALDDQSKPEAFAAKNVVVIGNLDKAANTIHVADMIAALPPEVTAAKVAFIDCDDCLRSMAQAKTGAIEEFVTWKRFKLTGDRAKADVVFLFSANPYLGDYATRKGADNRVVRVKTTYLNVVDPRTGENLWGDSRKWGYFRVSGAAKSLVNEFRAHLEAEQGQIDRLLEQDAHPEVPPPNQGK